MRKTMVVAAAAFIGGVGAAAAADLGGYGSVKDEPVTAVYGPNWAGLYVGGSVGYGWGDVSDTYTLTEISSGGTDRSVSSVSGSAGMNGAIYGAHLGYNFQRGNIVFGPEIGINGTTMDGAALRQATLSGVIQHDVDWYATAVGRLGYARDSFLFYGFGGVAWSKLETEIPSLNFKGDTTFVGWTAGLGVEYALSNSLSLRLEYSHVDLGNETTLHDRSIFDDGRTFIDNNEADLAFDVVKIGASYRFGSRDEALK
jgi:outer membrane immunogenic protein